MAYKKRELKLHKHGYYDLAREVLRQWHVDGKPRGDESGIKPWADLLMAHRELMHGKKEGTHNGSYVQRAVKYTEDWE